MAHIRPLCPQRLGKSPRRRARCTDERGIKEQFSPGILEIVDPQEIPALRRRNLRHGILPARGRQRGKDRRKPPPRPRTAVRGKRRDIRRAAALLYIFCRRKSELVMHNDIELCLCKIANARERHVAAEYMAHLISCPRQQAYKLPCIVLTVVVGRGHADEVDPAPHLSPCLSEQHIERRAGGTRPSVCKAADQSAAVNGDYGAGHPRRTCNRSHIVADQARRAAADDGEQRGRLLNMRLQCLAQIRLRTEHDCIVVELRALHAVRDVALALLDVPLRKEITPQRSVYDHGTAAQPCEERRRACQCTALHPHGHIVEGEKFLIHRSTLLCPYADRVHAPYPR